MALNQVRRWLVSYDVRDPRRLQRVHRRMVQVALPVQYSVFAAAGSPRAMRALAADLSSLIDMRADDVRFYPVPERPLVFTIGRSMLPADVMVLDARTDLGRLAVPQSATGGGA